MMMYSVIYLRLGLGLEFIPITRQLIGLWLLYVAVVDR